MKTFFKSLVVGLFLILAACNSSSGSSKPQKTFRLNLGSEPTSLHPQKVRNLESIFATRLLFEGLMRLGADDKPHEALAESFTVSEDGKTYVFKLKKSLWTSGAPLTATDFVYAWQKALDPSFPCAFAFQLFVIKNAEKIKKGELPAEALCVMALDETHLKIQLDNPVAYFLDLLTLPVFFPISQSVDEQSPNWSHEKESFVSNGPFVMEKWEHSSKLLLVKNKDFWNSAFTRLDRVDLCMVSTETELQLYEKGEIDWVGSPISSISLEALPTLIKKGWLNQKPFLGTYFLRLNTESKLLSNLKVRKALALSIDRRAITEQALCGSQRATTVFVPSELYGEGTEEISLEENRALAVDLLGKGLKELKCSKEDVHLQFIYSQGDDRNRIMATLLQEQWKNSLGIDVRLESMEQKAFLARQAEKKFDIASASWIADFPDPANFLDNYNSKTVVTNPTGWESEEYRALMRKAQAEGNQLYRLAFLKNAEKILLNESPIIPIFHYNMLFVKRENLQGIVLNDQGALDVSTAFFAEPESSP